MGWAQQGKARRHVDPPGPSKGAVQSEEGLGLPLDNGRKHPFMADMRTLLKMTKVSLRMKSTQGRGFQRTAKKVLETDPTHIISGMFSNENQHLPFGIAWSAKLGFQSVLTNTNSRSRDQW